MDYLLRFAGQLKQHIRALRRARNLTQKQLADKLGVGQSRIAEIESDPAAISVQQLFGLLAALEAQLLLRAEADTSDGEVSRAKRTVRAHKRRATTDDASW
ncbi:MAG: helix-turn-helix transcriptional regulator [Burkholderiaceae bacterium]